jgi:hypothetical protein
VGKLLSDLDFEVALQPPVGDGRSEYSHNLLGVLMVGRHVGADQTEWCGQPLEHVDFHAGVVPWRRRPGSGCARSRRR